MAKLTLSCIFCLMLALSLPGRASGRQGYAARADRIEAALKAKDPKRRLRERIDGGHYVAQEWRAGGRKISVSVYEYDSVEEAAHVMNIMERGIALKDIFGRPEGIGDEAFYTFSRRRKDGSLSLRKGRVVVSVDGGPFKVVMRFAEEIGAALARP